jgi:D-xylulose reductase
MKFAACPPDDLGALTKYFRLPEDCCYKLPEGVSLQEGALVEPLAVAVHVVRMAGITPGQSVAVMGAGTIGLLCAAVAKAYGAMTVVAVDILQKRLDFAKDYAATHTFLPDLKASAQENAEKLLRECGLGDGGGVDVVLECSGAESSIQTGIHVLKMGGQYVQAGLGRLNVSVPIVTLSEKEIHVHGSYRYGAGDFEMAIDLLKVGKVKLKSLITSVVDFERATEAWERTKRGDGIKNLIRGWRID